MNSSMDMDALFPVRICRSFSEEKPPCKARSKVPDMGAVI